MTRPKHDRSGFSLVEMTVALTILGIVMAFVLPNLHESLRSSQINRVPDELQADVRLALSAAKSQGRTYRIVFRDDGYLIRDLADSTRVLQDRSFGEHARFASSGDPLVFPWGIVQQTSVAVQGTGDDYHNLTLHPTGRLSSDNGS